MSQAGSSAEETVVPIEHGSAQLQRRPRRAEGAAFVGLLNEFDEARNWMLSSFWNPFTFPELSFRETLRAPTMDVEDRGDRFEVTVELPGIGRDRIEVRMSGNVLQVEADVHEERTADRRNYVVRERSERAYHRQIVLPEPVTEEQARATLQGGLLKITVPKAPRRTGRTAPVQ